MFMPSQVETDIYDILDKNILIYGNPDMYNPETVEEVSNYFDRKGLTDYEKSQIMVSEYPDESGASVSAAWIENGMLHMIGWDYLNHKEED